MIAFAHFTSYVKSWTASILCLSLVASASAQTIAPRTGDVLSSNKIVHGSWGDQFGRSVDVLGDINDDGITDLVVGASHSDDGQIDAGSVWILIMKSDGTVYNARKISQTTGGFVGPLAEGDQFGKCVAGLGDLDGDGVEDIAVGAARAGDVYILFLNSDGTVKSQTMFHNDDGDFGYALAPVGDFDGDNVTELVVGNGFGEVYLYYLRSDGTVKSSQFYRDHLGFYGIGISTIGDFDGDGIIDLAIGNTDSTGSARDEGYIELSFMDSNGVEKDNVQLKDGSTNLSLGLPNYPNWGRDIALIDDLDGNGVRDIAVGCSEDWQNNEPEDMGAVYIIFLEADGTAKDFKRITRGVSNFTVPIGAFFEFGISLASIGDWNGDGTTDLAVGARFDNGIGAVHILTLNDGTIEPPVAAATASPKTGNAPLNVTFTDNSTGSITGWLWDFGDGTTSTAQNATHTYLSEGQYDVTLSVTGPGLVSDSRTYPSVVDVEVPLAPISEFNVSPQEGLDPLTVVFTDSTAGPVTSWAWDFGDGTASTAQNPTHVYSGPGTYTPTLLASGPTGSDSKALEVPIIVHEAIAPTADFTALLTTVVVPEAIGFQSESQGFVGTWAWDFGDGNTSSESNPSHVYRDAGTYTVSLTVGNAVGSDTRTRTDYITVNLPPAPVADFSSDLTMGFRGLVVAFEDRSTGGATQSWLWNFGDGSLGFVRNPQHRYNEPGFYTVSMLATNAGGSSMKTIEDYIYVAPSKAVLADGAGGGLSALDGTYGYEFGVDAARTVVELGIADADGDGSLGNAGDAEVGLWRADGALLAQVTIPNNTLPSDGVFYVSIPPVDLVVGETYVVGAFYAAGGEPLAENGTALNAVSEFLWVQSRSSTNATFEFPGSTGNELEFFGPNLRFDDMPRISVYGTSVAENVGVLDIEVSMQREAFGDVEIDVTVVSGTATDGQDFIGTTETLTLFVGQTTAFVSIPILDDTLAETVEAFSVEITAVRGPAQLAASSAIVVVTSDEAPARGDFIASLTSINTADGDSMRGLEFEVTEEVTVVQLGTFDGDEDGNLNIPWDSVPVGLWEDDGTLLARVDIPSTATPENGVFYGDITPVVLVPGKNYVMAALYSNNDEPYLKDAELITHPNFNYVGERKETGATSFVFPSSFKSSNPDNDAEFFGATIRYKEADCDQDGIADANDNDPDCNNNGIPDTCETFTDCNANGIPDECEADCDGDGIPDDCDPCIPIPDFHADLDNGIAPLSIVFTDQSQGIVTSWAWDFGDGGSSSSANPTHTYTVAGTYAVQLTASGPYGSVARQELDLIKVAPPAPSADFTQSVSSGPAPLMVQFTDTSSDAPTSWLWSFGDGGTSTQPNPSYAYSNPGTYAVSLTVTNVSGDDTKAIASAVVVEIPLPVARGESNLLGGIAPVEIAFTDRSSGTITSWTWYFGDGTSSSEQNPTHTYTEPGAYTASLVVGNTSGTDGVALPGPIQVIEPPATSDFIASATLGTVPLTVAFTDTSIGVVTAWSWDFGDGNQSSLPSPEHTYSSVGTYTVALTTSNPAGSDTNTRVDYITVEQTPAPTADLNANATQGSTPFLVTFTDASIGAVTSWAWSFGDGETSSEENPSHVYDVVGTYTVALEVSNAGGADTATYVDLIIVVEPPATPNFEAATTTGSVPLAIQFNDLSAGVVTGWSWDFGDGSTSTDQSPEHTYSTVGTYSVSLTATNRGGAETHTRANYIVAVEAPAVPDFGADVTNGIVPLTVTFQDLTTGVVTGWQWDFGDGNTSSDSNPVHTYTEVGTYAVTLAATNRGGSELLDKPAYIVVEQIPAPVAAASADVQGGIIPLSVAFSDESTGDATAWAWDFGDGNTSSIENPQHTYSSVGTYTVTLAATNAGGSDTAVYVDFVVAVDPPVTSAFEADVTTGSIPLSVQFSDTSSGVVTAWSWDFGDGNTSTDPSPQHTFEAVGTYSVSLTTTNRGGADTVTRTDYIVAVEPIAAADFGADVTRGSFPLAVQFSDRSTGVVTGWNWDFGDGATSSLEDPQHTYSEIGTYSVTLVVSNRGGDDTLTRTDYVVVLDTAPVADFDADETLGTVPLTVAFNDLSKGVITAWAWSFGDGAASTDQNPTHIYDAVGTFTVALTVTNGGGADTRTRTDYLVVEQIPPPVASAGMDVVGGSVPLNVAFSDQSSGDPTSWSWSFGDGATSTNQNPTHVYTLVGSYSVELTVSNAGGSGTVTFDDAIMVYDVPAVPDFTADVRSGSSPLGVRFADLSTGVISSWNWDFGDGNTSSMQSPFHTYSSSGTYTVSLSVSNSGGTERLARENYIVVSQVPAPTTEFAAAPITGNAPLTTIFMDLSTATATSWLWDFGDGGTSTVENPSYVYGSAGTYTVTLTASNGGGSTSETKVDFITVNAPADGIADGSFETAPAGTFPVFPWSVEMGGGHRILPTSVPQDVDMPLEGSQWLQVSSAGSVAALPPGNPGGEGRPSSGGAGVVQYFSYSADQPVLRFGATFLLNGVPGDASFNDWMSVEVSDGLRTVCVYYADSFSEFPAISEIRGFPMAETEDVVAILPELFPGSDSSTVFSVSVRVGNGGDGNRSSVGYVDDFRMVEDNFAKVEILGCLSPEGSMRVSGPPAFDTPFTFELDNPLGTQCAVSTVVELYFTLRASPNVPCGTIYPGFGMDGGDGEAIIDPTTQLFVVPVGGWGGPGVPATLTMSIPSLPALVGIDIYAQALFWDSTRACGVEWGVTEAVRLTLGF